MTVDRSVESRGKLPTVWRGAGLALAAALMAACGGGGESGAPTQLPTRSGNDQPSVTATIPSPTRALPDRSKSPDDTLTATPEPTRTQTETATQTETQTATETATQTATATPRETSETPSPTDSVSPAAKKNSGDETNVPAWLWWLLGAAIVALAVGIPLFMRAKRRRAWQAEFVAAEQEVTWFVQELLPELQRAGSAAAVGGGWAVGESRVATVEDRLTELAASGRDETGTTRAVALRDAVRQSRERIRALAESGATDVSRDLAVVAADLAASLRRTTPAP